MSSKAVVVEGLAKRYSLGQDTARYRTIRESIADRFRGRTRAPSAEIWALRGVSLSVDRGDVLGIVGPNGAGKSTLLKILSRVTEPTSGRAVVHGRIGSLLEVGTGFHPELTGRENVMLSAAILGMSRAEVRQRFDAIVAFAEVEQFLDTPVKRYSSGMYMRLAFSVAAHLEPDILLVDEVLAVGDLGFQRKAIERMRALVGRCTILFVSHNLHAVARFCTSAIVLDHGTVAYRGSVDRALSRYEELVVGAHGAGAAGDRLTSDVAAITRVTLRSASTDEPSREFRSGDAMVVEIAYECRQSLAEPQFHVVFRRAGADTHCTSSTVFDRVGVGTLHGSGRLSARVSALNLPPGMYTVQVFMSDPGHLVDYSAFTSQPFEVTSDLPISDVFGAYLINAAWEHSS